LLQQAVRSLRLLVGDGRAQVLRAVLSARLGDRGAFVNVRGGGAVDQETEQLRPAVVTARVHQLLALVHQREVEVGDDHAFARAERLAQHELTQDSLSDISTGNYLCYQRPCLGRNFTGAIPYAPPKSRRPHRHRGRTRPRQVFWFTLPSAAPGVPVTPS